MQPYHLTTKEYDSDVGLYYFSARWYARWPGRFISRDPGGGFNWYEYCLSTPNCVDATGEEECITKTFPMAIYKEPTRQDTEFYEGNIGGWTDWLLGKDVLFVGTGVKCPEGYYVKSKKVSVTWYRCVEYVPSHAFTETAPVFACVRWGYVDEPPDASECKGQRCETVIGLIERLRKGKPVKARAIVVCCKCDGGS